MTNHVEVPGDVAAVPPPDRLIALDVVRGVAVLGILAMNIVSIGLPGAARLNPFVAGGFDGANRLLWWAGYLFFDEKMIAVFSMLFGAGLVLQADRVTQNGRSPARLFYRRVGVLLLFGLVHAYLVWDGDILVTYALCGMLVFPLRRLSPRVLLALGTTVMLMAIPPGLVVAKIFGDARASAQLVEFRTRDGVASSPEERAAARDWQEIRRAFQPTPTELADVLDEARSEGYVAHVRRKAPEARSVQTELFFSAFLWLVGGRMLIGMALMKLGVFAGHRSRRFYAGLAIAGYAVGLPLVAQCGEWLVARQFDPVAIFGGGLLWNSYAGMFVALGHIGLVISVAKAGWWPPLIARLAATGRMAFSNYLAQSLICTALFCGWGLGLVGRLDRVALYLVMLGIWSAQLIYSPWWLARFRFGPAEWLWRSLTYGRGQPFRLPALGPLAAS